MIEAGACRLGVRSNTLEADRVLRRVLTGHVVPGAHRRASYSLWLAPSGTGGRHDLHLLYRHAELVARSRSVGHLIGRLVAHLAAHVEIDDLVPLRMVALLTEPGAVLVPEELRRRLAERESRLNRLNLQVVDAPLATLDPASGDLVVADPGRLGDLAAVDGGQPSGIDVGSLPWPGRYPVLAWGFPAGDGAAPLSPGGALALAMERVSRPDVVGRRRALAALARAAEGAGVCSVDLARDAVAVVAEVLASVPRS